MILRELEIPGAYVVELERLGDERGFFARSFCEQEFATEGIDVRMVQSNISFNRRHGTLRGLHYQAKPFEEDKLVRCTMGSAWDVIVDLRTESPMVTRWVAQTLSAENRRALFVPRGCAHGFLTLEDDTEIFYQMSEYYKPEAARGVAWDDPAFGIEWPEAPAVVSERDASYPRFSY